MNPPLVGLMMLLFESRRRYAGRPGGYPARALGVRAQSGDLADLEDMHAAE
jgi:hypothetical protein